jgi:hypothetical protein
MQIGSARMRKKQSFLRTLKIAFPIFLGLALFFAAPCWCQSQANRNNQQRTYERTQVRGNGQAVDKNKSHAPVVRKQSSHSNNQRLMNKAQEFEKLPPQKQNELHNNMDRFKSLPPEDRTLYQKRFDQMQQLPPDERNDVRNKLRRMDRLSPAEKDEIRRKFE